MEIETDLMPQRISHLPVVAAVAAIEQSGDHNPREWVVVCHDSRYDTYITWHVYAQRHAVTGEYLAVNGHYDMTYGAAVDDMMNRAGWALRP